MVRIGHAMRGGVGKQEKHSQQKEELWKSPVVGKNSICVGIWVRRICMVVGCGSPGTWCHKETDLKGLEGGYPGRSMRVYSFMETEREHEFGIQHPLGENHLS